MTNEPPTSPRYTHALELNLRILKLLRAYEDRDALG